MSIPKTHRRSYGGTVWRPRTKCGRTVTHDRIHKPGEEATCSICRRAER